MKQTNVKKSSERLSVNLSIRKGAGYSTSKQIAKRFFEEKIHYKFIHNKYSAMFNFSTFYIKIFYPEYENGKVEIVVYKNDFEVKKVLDIIMDLISNITIECEKNNIFLTSNVALTLNDEICLSKLDKQSYSSYSFNKEGKIYDLSTKVTYNFKNEGGKRNVVLYRESISISMHLKNGMISFVPNLFSKFIAEIDEVRKEMRIKIEKI